MFAIKNVKFLYSALQCMEEIDYECAIKLSSTGMEIQGIGPSRVSLFKFVLGDLGTDFKVFGVSLTNLSKVLERVKNAKKIELDYDSRARKMVLKTKIKNKNKTYRLSEIDADVANIPFDKLLTQPYEIAFTLLTKDLVDVFKDNLIYSERCTIGIKDGMLSFRSASASGSSFIQLEDFTYTKDFGTTYSLTLIMSKIKKMQSFEVSLVLGEDLPIYLNYEFDNGYLKIFVAPMVEEDDF